MDISLKIAEVMKEAAKIMLEAHDAEESVTEKWGAANFVTKYDVAVEDFLYEKLAKLVPDAIFIGEESTDNHSELLSKGLSFIIDPIDGTTNFIHDYRHSCVSVALCDKGSVIAGVVYDPYLDEVFAAEKGKGAYVNGRRVYVSNRALADSIISFGTTPYTRSHAPFTFKLAYELFSASCDIRRSGSAALDICNIASARSDAFFEVSLSPWDYAAGSLLMTEAGGIITQFDGSPITLDKPCSILAGGEKVYGEIKSIIEKLKNE